MKIKLCDVWIADEPYRVQIDDAVMRVINDSAYVGTDNNPYLKKFEKNFAKYIGVEHCAGVSSCTSALHLALEALDVKGKVLCPSMTVSADAEAVLMANCTPVFYDTIDSVENMAKDCKAIIVVHLYGNPVNMDKVAKIARENSLFAIEDCAQSTGAEWDGKKTGSFGDVSCFSFFPSKVLGGYGDSGALLANNELLADKVKALRNHGRIAKEKVTHSYVGYNYRMDGMQAAVLDVKLRYLDMFITKRRWAAELYKEKLPGKSFKSNEGHVYYLCPIVVKDRDNLKKFLASKGVETGRHYPVPLHKQIPYQEYECCCDMDKTDYLAEHELSLPIFPGITEKQIGYVCEKVEEFYEK